MTEFTLRNYVELGYLMINRKSSAAVFTEYFMLSNYEYHTDMEKVSLLAEGFGMQISEDGTDILLKVVDTEAAESVELALTTFYHSYRYSFNDRYALIRLALAQKLLWGTVAFNMDEVAEEIGYSRSNLREGIKEARNTLTNFNIDIVSKPHYGLVISGNEFDKRRCLISIYSNYDTRIIHDNIDENIITGFRNETYNRIGDIVRKNISKEGYTISSSNRRKINIYLVIQNARIKKGFGINGDYSIDDRLLSKILENAQLRKISVNILNDLIKTLDYGSYNEQEVISLMIILSSLATFSKHQSRIVDALYEEERQKLGDAVFSVLRDIWHFEFDQKTETRIGKVIDNIVMYHHLGELQSVGYRLKGRPGKIYGYPLINRINENLCTVISDFYGYKAASSQIEGICEILYYHIEMLELDYPKPRIAVACRGNEFENQLLLETVKKEVSSEYYQSIEACDYISINNTTGGENAGYDLVICDQKVNSDVTFLALENFDFNFGNIEYYLRHSRNLMAKFENGPHYVERRDIDFLDLEQLQKCVCDLSSRLEADEDLIKDSFNYYIDTGECRIIIIPLQKCSLYLSLGDIISKTSGKAKKCMIIAAGFSRKNVRLLNALIRELTGNSRFFNALMLDGKFEIANNQLNEILR
ncbi:MAG: helix-turn-helix domain-containing protein [Erysipelotrichaceae bacterium]|nr:helix-turn-helix domain-containing protein [Erysipelotrichaceae bacterium]